MTKRYREPVEVVEGRAGAHHPVRHPLTGAPRAFRWRGVTYRVLAVLGHWREDAGYWSGGGVEVPQRDLWRVEARNGRAGGRVGPGTGSGVYELVSEAGRWRLDRVWD